MKATRLAAIVSVSVLSSCGKNDGDATSGGSEPAGQELAERVDGQGDERRGDRDGAFPKQDRERKAEFARRLGDAKRSFDGRDIGSALKLLEEADKLSAGNVELLNLRGTCHVEQRDFESALKDFLLAADKSPGNPSILFNLGEVYFVTKRWDDAIRVWELAKDRLSPDSESVRSLIDFKLMLCEIGRGDDERFGALADAHVRAEGSPLAEYTKVVRVLKEGGPEASGDVLAAVNHRFDAEVRAPWTDTLVEFGFYLPGLEDK